jgi:hypothetical protein
MAWAVLSLSPRKPRMLAMTCSMAGALAFMVFPHADAERRTAIAPSLPLVGRRVQREWRYFAASKA